MVIFRSADGKPGYHQAETLEEAVGFVERLRNEEHVTDARVFRMEEVAIEFKVYYRVAVAGEATGGTEPAAEVAAAPEAVEPTGEAAPDASPADGDELAASNGNPGRFGLFSRT